MPIKISGKDYVTVSERVSSIHENEKKFSITTEIIPHDELVIVKATVTIKEKGTFTGISAVNPAKTIERQNPYEVAETSAVGRALGFAGYGVIDSIASAEEIIKAKNEEETHIPTKKPINAVTIKAVESVLKRMYPEATADEIAKKLDIIQKTKSQDEAVKFLTEQKNRELDVINADEVANSLPTADHTQIEEILW